jgi:phenylacetic acid degradation operon negative regulatory protein
MPAQRPKDLIFTLFGDFLLHRPEPVWVGSLIELLAPLGLSEGAVRTVLSRMAAKGWLEAERRGRNSFYRLTGRGRRLLEEGEARIYHPPRDEEWDGSWYLVAYSIPEDRRQLRDRLRVRLLWLGCGSLGNGLYITPHAIGSRIEEIADGLEIRDHLEFFQADHAGFSNVAQLVARCWDLPSINLRYKQFIDRYLPDYESSRTAIEENQLTGEQAFVRRFALVHEYREFPLIDPYLPRPLQPADWGGECSAALFSVYHDLLMPLADEYVDQTVAAAPESAEAVAMGAT